MPLRQAIKEGVSETGGVITSAGLILAGTFAVLATLPLELLVHFGNHYGYWDFDGYVYRSSIFVPAITMLLGKKAFWPAKAELIDEPERQNASK